ncbi:hypothetical protein EDD15DRAFT_2264782, partial [Pisolithus albus]
GSPPPPPTHTKAKTRPDPSTQRHFYDGFLPSEPISVPNKRKSAQKPKSMSRTLLPYSHNNKQEASDSDMSSRVCPRMTSLVREQSEKKDSMRPRRSGREPSRLSRLRKATQGIDGEGDRHGSTDNRGDDKEEEGGRGGERRDALASKSRSVFLSV